MSLNGVRTWSAEEMHARSEGYTKVMNRCWYLAASSDNNAGQSDAYWAVNQWVPGHEGTRFTHHTVTRSPGRRPVDFGLWKGAVDSGYLVLKPTVKLFGLSVPLFTDVPTHWMSFPEDDRPDHPWTYGLNIMGRRLYFIFALTPHLSDERCTAEVERLQSEHLVDAPFYRVRWNPEGSPGDWGEDVVNTSL